MRRTVSVIIPTFNRALLVQEAIESVLGQRCDARFEIIVIDDGSTPHTEAALRSYRDRIRYVRQENAGLNAARNRALRLATGDYIALLDDDDVWLPFKTQLELAALDRFPNAAFVHSNFFIWKPAGGRRADGIRTWFPRPYAWSEMYGAHAELQIDSPERYGLTQSSFRIYCGDTYYWALFAPMVLPSSAILRRAALDPDLQFPEFDSTCGDWDFFARLSHRHGGVFVADETTLNRSHEDPWRLTRVDSGIQMRRRIALIRRLWRQDPAFLGVHGDEVDATEAQCLRKLAKRQLINGENAGAREALAELKQLGSGLARRQDMLLGALARLPFSRKLVNLLRTLKGGTGSRQVG